MELEYPNFGTIVVDGQRYDHDVVIEAGQLRARDKGPSKALKGRFGHTPLSADESLPWSKSTLVIGSGYSGRLPVMPEVAEEAQNQGVDLVVLPTADAVGFLNQNDVAEMNAILHVTC